MTVWSYNQTVYELNRKPRKKSNFILKFNFSLQKIVNGVIFEIVNFDIQEIV